MYKNKKLYKNLNLKIFYPIIFIGIIFTIIFPKFSLASEKTYSINGIYDSSDIKFYLYRIGKVDKNQAFVVDDRFKNLEISYKDLLKTKTSSKANTIAAYISKNKIKADFTQKSDKDYKLRFSNLKSGIYLLLADEYQKANVIYSPSPLIFTLKDSDINFVGRGKVSKRDIDRKINIEVYKIWEDKDLSKRPSFVNIVLLKDKKEYDKVVLSKKNNWRYVWKDLSSESSYEILEDKVDFSYNFRVEREGNIYKVINTKKEIPKNEIKKEKTPKEETKKKDKKIVYTGQYWRRMYISLGLSFVFLVIGLLKNRKNYEKV